VTTATNIIALKQFVFGLKKSMPSVRAHVLLSFLNSLSRKINLSAYLGTCDIVFLSNLKLVNKIQWDLVSTPSHKAHPDSHDAFELSVSWLELTEVSFDRSYTFVLRSEHLLGEVHARTISS
jgi:hypothetical protein